MTHPLQAKLSGTSGTTAVLAGLLLASFGAAAQTEPEITSKRTVSVVPRISLTETYTDNLYLTGSPTKSEWVTELSPGVKVDIAGARLKAFFDYSFTKLAYASEGALGRSQNSLNTGGTLEAIEKWFFVDFGGMISQQSISAFGTQAGSNNTAINGNQTEVAEYRISPYLRGRLAGAVDYEARISRDTTRPKDDVAPGSASTDAFVTLTGGGRASGLGWTADVGQRNDSYTTGRDTEAQRINLGLYKAFSPQVKVTAKIGHESNDYTTVDRQTYDTYSLGLNWAPSEVTKLAATVGHRYFGNAHDISFEHRTGRTVWTFSDVVDDYTQNQSGMTSQGSNYDLLYRQFAAVEPDPTARATLVSNYLQKNGISATAVSSSFLSSAVTLERRQSLSFALLGLRDTILLSVSQTRSTRVDTLSTGVDDLTNSDVVRQQWLNANYSHRLTPDTSLGVTLSRQDTSGDNSLQDTSLKELHVNLTGKIGKHAAATLGARRMLFQSNTAPYAESALIGTFNMQF